MVVVTVVVPTGVTTSYSVRVELVIVVVNALLPLVMVVLYRV